MGRDRSAELLGATQLHERVTRRECEADHSPSRAKFQDAYGITSTPLCALMTLCLGAMAFTGKDPRKYNPSEQQYFSCKKHAGSSDGLL